MSDWFRGITTGEWTPRTSPQSESPAEGDGMSTMAFHPPRPSEHRTKGNVWTLRNGERLDTPERFFDWLECWYRDDAVACESGDLDRLINRRRAVETRANQRLQRSIN